MRASGPWRSASAPAVLGVLTIVLSACTNDNPSLRFMTIVPPADMPIRFSADVQPIFNRSCALSGCHTGSFAFLGLSLDEGKAYSNLVGVPSGEDTNFQRVEPGRSDRSYLVHKLEGTGLFDPMPLGGQRLPGVEIQLIKDWIDQGAVDN